MAKKSIAILEDNSVIHDMYPELQLLSGWSFVYSSLVLMGFQVFQFTNTSQKHANRQTGYVKLPLGVAKYAMNK